MRMDKLTSQFQKALADAQSLAVGRDQQFVEPPHVMAAVGARRRRGGPLAYRAGHGPGPPAARAGMGGDLQISRALGRLLNLADKYARQRWRRLHRK